MRFVPMMTALGALSVLGACATLPDSGAGVGFDNSLTAPRTAPATPLASALPPPQAVSGELLPQAPTLAPADPVQLAAAQALGTPPQGQQDIIRDAAAALDAASQNSGVAPLEASPSNPAPLLVGNPGLSDENDFAAVAQRESIESDAQRIAQNTAQYQVIAPTAVPSRAGVAAQPNIVQYALQTDHPRGTRVWQRVGLNMVARAQRACAGYPSPDQAQIDFLASGGPQRDRKGLDPDGDGYACAWDPAPFRAAVRN